MDLFSIETMLPPLAALSGFSMSSSDLGNGNYRFVIYTLSSNVIAAGTNPLLDLPITVSSTIAYGDYNFDFSGVVLSNTSNQNTATEALTEGRYSRCGRPCSG